MIVFPNCKINLGLHITGKRDDGFHNLETVFYPVPLKDALEIIEITNSELPTPDSELPTQDCYLTNTGITAEKESADNICVKAYHLLKKHISSLPSVNMHLHKAIPIGAGLGGGSADAAFTLKLLNQKFKLNLSEKELINYALELGSDAPFFIINKPCFASGRGEILEEISIDLKNYTLVLINPGIHINTGQAFSQLKNFTHQSSLKKVITRPVQTWKNELTNDFEIPVFSQYPEIEEIKKTLYETGAEYASMSGSGSTVFGLFKKLPTIKGVFPDNYFTAILPL